MPKEEWGTKRVCPTTGRRFYDLGRMPIISPYTGETVTIDTNARGRVTAAAKEKPKADEIEADDTLIDDDDDVVIDDDDDLADDVLEDDDDDDVSLDDIADVATNDDD